MYSHHFLPVLFASAAYAVNNGLARTPQMGWDNWNSLGCDVSESLLLDTSRKLIDTGLRDLGYNYVILDDCWSEGRGADGILRADTTKFPHGMKWVAEQLHNEGLLFGMYSSAGELTCARYEGSLDWEKEDAQTWASWDVDYLKYDNCFHMGRFGYPEVSYNRFNAMWKALNDTGRPMLYSLCSWGEDYVHTWGMSTANSWRMSGDIYDSFTRPDDLCACTNAADPHCTAPGNHCSVLYIINKVATFADRGGPGGWNDLDMLEVGQGGMSDSEYVAHFSMWAALKSPLLIGADLRKLSASTLTILNNPAVIAINQDPLGRSVLRVQRNMADIKKDKYGQGETQVWSGELYGGDQAVVFLNAADEDLEMSATLDEIFVHQGPEGSASQTKLAWGLHDLWADRMEEEIAVKIIETPATDLHKVFEDANLYNSTALSYSEGLKRGDEKLLGRKVGEVEPKGEIKVMVTRHAVKMFRLRSTQPDLKRYSLYKDEL